MELAAAGMGRLSRSGAVWLVDVPEKLEPSGIGKGTGVGAG